MKKTAALFIASCILVAACHKYDHGPALPARGAMAGSWRIDSVTTYFYDSTGINSIGVQGYGHFPGYIFTFNPDSSWVETMQDSTLTQGISNGTYTITSDSTFTLLIPNATPSTAVEPCKIVSLTGTLFIFSTLKRRLVNGTASEYIKYVFRLLR